MTRSKKPGKRGKRKKQQKLSESERKARREKRRKRKLAARERNRLLLEHRQLIPPDLEASLEASERSDLLVLLQTIPADPFGNRIGMPFLSGTDVMRHIAHMLGVCEPRLDVSYLSDMQARFDAFGRANWLYALEALGRLSSPRCPEISAKIARIFTVLPKLLQEWQRIWELWQAASHARGETYRPRPSVQRTDRKAPHPTEGTNSRDPLPPPPVLTSDDIPATYIATARELMRDQRRRSAASRPSSLTDAGLASEGPLKRLGYYVGTEGRKRGERRATLLRVFHSKGQESGDSVLPAKWGPARSSTRMQNIVDSIARFRTWAEKNTAGDYSAAIHDWTEDLDWLNLEFGRFYSVRWR